jgi:hypothetical protein
MEGYLSVVETAKILRTTLKAKFSGTKFSIRSSSYAGGASIDIGWTDGPTSKEVKKVTSGFEGAGFDGMIDMKFHYDSWLMPDGTATTAHSPGTEGSMGVYSKVDNPKPHPDAKKVHFGADYIFLKRAHSAEAVTAAMNEVCKEHGYEPATVMVDSFGASIAWSDKRGDQGGDDNPTSIWTLRNLTSKRMENEYPYDAIKEPGPGDAEYETLRAKIAKLEGVAA